MKCSICGNDIELRDGESMLIDDGTAICPKCHVPDSCIMFDLEFHDERCPDKKHGFIVRTPLDHYEPDDLESALRIIRFDFKKLRR